MTSNVYQLNCVRAGDTLDEIFTINIASGRRVTNLRPLIADRLRQHDGSIVLWKLLLPLDKPHSSHILQTTSTLEGLGNQNCPLTPREKLEDLFGSDPDPDFLHVVVQIIPCCNFFGLLIVGFNSINISFCSPSQAADDVGRELFQAECGFRFNLDDCSSRFRR
jgi:Crinkler effector protein N-terminal domain